MRARMSHSPIDAMLAQHELDRAIDSRDRWAESQPGKERRPAGRDEEVVELDLEEKGPMEREVTQARKKLVGGWRKRN